MPETALGLFPDIGASYFLSRLPGFFGNGKYFLDQCMSIILSKNLGFQFQWNRLGNLSIMEMLISI